MAGPARSGSGCVNVNNINALVAKVVGAVLLLVGLLGFVPNPIVSADGIFMVDTIHNLVHLGSGIALLAVGFMNNGQYARVGNQTLGVVYALVAVLGLANILLAPNGLIASNTADDVLHILLAIVFLGVGFGVKEETRAGRPMRT